MPTYHLLFISYPNYLQQYLQTNKEYLQTNKESIDKNQSIPINPRKVIFLTSILISLTILLNSHLTSFQRTKLSMQRFE